MCSIEVWLFQNQLFRFCGASLVTLRALIIGMIVLAVGQVQYLLGCIGAVVIRCVENSSEQPNCAIVSLAACQMDALTMAASVVEWSSDVFSSVCTSQAF